MTGQVVGQYRFVEKLGEGGMGTVYKGIDLMVEREVAIKMLRPEIAHQPELVERFRTEAITLARLNSPGIATLYNFFREGEDYFMVMEFLAGRTVEQALKQGGPMSWERGVPLFCRILESIEPAHRAGVLHRDIKPANIMLTDGGGVKVMDFGIARVLGTARVTQVGTVIGTMEYIAPERIQGSEADIRADIYSLGVVMYEMLSCHLPFESVNQFEMMRRHIHVDPPALRTYEVTVPAVIEHAMLKALAKQPRERYASCSEMEAALWSAMDAVGWQQPVMPKTVRSEMPWYPSSVAGDAANQTTVLADRTGVLPGGGTVAQGVAPTGLSRVGRDRGHGSGSILDRLRWKHYLAGAVLALLLGAGVMFVLNVVWGGAAQPGVSSRGSQNGLRVAPGTPAGSAAKTGPDSHLAGSPPTDVDARAQERAQAAEQQRRREAALKALDEN